MPRRGRLVGADAAAVPAELEAACMVFCEQVNAREHRFR
jgi:hypothetical protein